MPGQSGVIVTDHLHLHQWCSSYCGVLLPVPLRGMRSLASSVTAGYGESYTGVVVLWRYGCSTDCSASCVAIFPGGGRGSPVPKQTLPVSESLPMLFRHTLAMAQAIPADPSMSWRLDDPLQFTGLQGLA